ncbi:hypothetical protein PYCC9005_003630 [Savitreella phatthalungensis]
MIMLDDTHTFDYNTGVPPTSLSVSTSSVSPSSAATPVVHPQQPQSDFQPHHAHSLSHDSFLAIDPSSAAFDGDLDSFSAEAQPLQLQPQLQPQLADLAKSSPGTSSPLRATSTAHARRRSSLAPYQEALQNLHLSKQQQQQQQQQQSPPLLDNHFATATLTATQPQAAHEFFKLDSLDPFFTGKNELDAEAQDVVHDMADASAFGFPGLASSVKNDAQNGLLHQPSTQHLGVLGAGPFARRGSLQHDQASPGVSSPASTYAPSAHGRNSSISYPKAFKLPTEANMDRRLSSPAIVSSQSLYDNSQTLGSALGSDLAQAQWTPNFTFGGPTNGAADTSSTLGDFAIPESRRSSANSSIAPGSSASSAILRRPMSGLNGAASTGLHPSHFNASMQVPTNFNFDRRMSVPVLGTNMPNYGAGLASMAAAGGMPNAIRGRQASAVDWKQFNNKSGDGGANRGFNRDELFYDTLSSARAMAQMSSQQQPNLDVNSTTNALKQQMQARRRQSMPFIGGTTFDGPRLHSSGFGDDAASLFAGGSSAGGFSSGSDISSNGGTSAMQPPSIHSGDGLTGLPNQASMMSTFSSKDADSNQKKHVCPVCKKRFTRPSSLTTHIYSHTGEKPFVCPVDGCGRHFSVISNLRRHRKIHKSGGSGSSHASAAAI